MQLWKRNDWCALIRHSNLSLTHTHARLAHASKSAAYSLSAAACLGEPETGASVDLTSPSGATIDCFFCCAAAAPDAFAPIDAVTTGVVAAGIGVKSFGYSFCNTSSLVGGRGNGDAAVAFVCALLLLSDVFDAATVGAGLPAALDLVADLVPSAADVGLLELEATTGDLMRAAAGDVVVAAVVGFFATAATVPEVFLPDDAEDLC